MLSAQRFSEPFVGFLDTCAETKGDAAGEHQSMSQLAQLRLRSAPHCPDRRLGPLCRVQVPPLQEGAQSRDNLLPPANRREPSATARYHLRMAVAKSWSICLRDETLQMDTQMFLLLPAGFREENAQRGLASRAALCGVL